MQQNVVGLPDTPAAQEQNQKPRNRSKARVRFELIYKELRTRICLFVYPPGTLLREGEIAAEFNVSRTPVRMVLSRLEFDGFVEVKHGVGTIVSSDVLEDLHDIYEFRMRLAELIGELNPILPSEKDVEAMRDLLASLRARGSNLTLQDYWHFNVTLHIQLEKCTGNRWLRETSDRLFHLTNRYWQAEVATEDSTTEAEHFIRELEEIIGCMEAGDVVGVGMVRRNAIYKSYLRLLRHRESTEPERGAVEPSIRFADSAETSASAQERTR